MEENKNINEFDNLFKEAFNNAEVTPPANAWSSIQSQIGSAGAGAAGTGGGFISGLTSIKGIIIAAAVVTGIVTTVVLTSDEEAAKADKVTTENTVANNNEKTTPDITTNSNTGNDDVELPTGESSTITTNTPNNGGTQESKGVNSNTTPNSKLPQTTRDYKNFDPNASGTGDNGDRKDLSTDGMRGWQVQASEETEFPKVSFTQITEGNICAGTFVKFKNTSTGKLINTYKWNFGDNSEPQMGEEVSHYYDKPGKYKVVLTAITDFGNEYTDERVVTVGGTYANFTTEDLGEGKFKFTNTSVSKAGATFKWNFGDDSENEGVTSPEHQYYSENATNYKVSLIVTDPMGCADTFENRIVNRYLITKEAPTAPNVFTPATANNPTGFGINDEFTVAISGEDYYSLVIYSGKNEVVFKSTDKENKWNGKDLSGNLCAAGSYYYILKYSYQGDDEVRQKSGTVTIIR